VSELSVNDTKGRCIVRNGRIGSVKELDKNITNEHIIMLLTVSLSKE
jgi:hypothetical protein